MGAVTELADGQLCPNPLCGRNNSRSESICPKCGTEQKQLLGKGTVLIGRYQIDAVLGCGGFGAVYKATNLLTGQFVAVKENRQHRTFARFEREANLFLNLNHPHLPQVHEFFLDAVTGRAYLVTDFVDGETLEALVKKRGRLSWDEAKPIFGALVDAVAYLHEHGVVHRDIKPANIIVIQSANEQVSAPDTATLRQFVSAKHFRQGRKFARQIVKGDAFGDGFVVLHRGRNRLAGVWRDRTSGQEWHLWVRLSGLKIKLWRCECPDGQGQKMCSHLLALLAIYREQPSAFVAVNDSPQPPVALVDFGVAKVMEPADPSRPHSSSVIAWTDGFSPPEQYRSGIEVDPKVDQYALAATLLFALTGDIPTDALTRLELACRGEPVPPFRPPKIPDAVWGAIERAMDLDPQRRFPSVKDFWEEACRDKARGVSVPKISFKEPLKSFVSRIRHRIPFLEFSFSLSGHSDSVSALAFSHNSEWLASGSFDRTVQIWDCREAKRLKVLKGHEDSVLGLVFSSDGFRLGSTSADKTVRLWHWREENAVIILHGHNEAVLTIACSPDGRFFATGSADGCIRLFQWRDSQLIWKSETFGAFVNAVAFSPDGRFLAFGCADGVVGFLSTRDGKFLRRLCETGYSITSIAFSPDGLHLAISGEGFGVQIWQLPEGKIARTLGQTLTKAKGWVNAVAFSPDGQLIATASMDEVVRLWRVADGKLARTLKGHKGWVTTVAFSPDGRWLASGSSDRTIRLWRLR